MIITNQIGGFLRMMMSIYATGEYAMRKEFEIQGCVEVPMELSKDEFWHKFIDLIEANNWSFGGGIILYKR